ncbi:MAG TPA: MgtC/SapB family protein [Acidimicrobiia bacterium]|nr:MgtC/SapB family protein [Acidimicrobiia bacterium]
MDFTYSWSSQLESAGLVAIAAVLGGIIGYDRETANKPAGLRTHMMVAGATGLVAAVGRTVFFDAGGHMGDPARALQAAIMGIGFIGAGTIITREGDMRVEGLTTAGSLFFAAAIGVGTGFGLVPLAVVATALVVLILSGVRAMEHQVQKRRRRDLDDVPPPMH